MPHPGFLPLRGPRAISKAFVPSPRPASRPRALLSLRLAPVRLIPPRLSRSGGACASVARAPARRPHRVPGRLLRAPCRGALLAPRPAAPRLSAHPAPACCTRPGFSAGACVCVSPVPKGIPTDTVFATICIAGGGRRGVCRTPAIEACGAPWGKRTLSDPFCFHF